MSSGDNSNQQKETLVTGSVSDDGEMREMQSSSDDNASNSHAAATASFIEGERRTVSDDHRHHHHRHGVSQAAEDILKPKSPAQKQEFKDKVFGKGDQKQQEPSKAACNEIEIQDIIFGIRIMNKIYTEVPIVRNSLDLTFSIYNFVKKSNCISECMLSRAERAAYAVQTSKNGFVECFKNSWRCIDSVLCFTLDEVEKRLPVIKSTPTKMIEDTGNMVHYVCTGRCALDCICKTVEKSFSLVLCKPIQVSYTEKEGSLCNC